MIDIAVLNSWDEAESYAAFLRCCEARAWAKQMTSRRPFNSEAELVDAARVIWQELGYADWLEAFAAHPKIGDLESLKKRFASTATWAASEQAGVLGASDAIFSALAEGNSRYEVRYGYIFIICATGKSAAEMLALLQSRLDNDPEKEIEIAAAEQEKITLIRLQKITS